MEHAQTIVLMLQYNSSNSWTVYVLTSSNRLMSRARTYAIVPPFEKKTTSNARMWPRIKLGARIHLVHWLMSVHWLIHLQERSIQLWYVIRYSLRCPFIHNEAARVFHDNGLESQPYNRQVIQSHNTDNICLQMVRKSRKHFFVYQNRCNFPCTQSHCLSSRICSTVANAFAKEMPEHLKFCICQQRIVKCTFIYSEW